MKSPMASWLLVLLRYGLCAAAIVYLYLNVKWNDRVRLNDAAGTPAVLVEERGDRLVVERDGRREELGREQVRQINGVTAIEYGIRSVVQRTDLGLAVLAIVLFLPVPFLQSLRLVWMLAIQDVRLSFWNSVKLSFAGNFFNFAMPGTVGGDLIKAFYITRFARHKTEAVTTVFLDRVIGLLGLMMLASVMIVVSRKLVAWDPKLFGSIAWGLSLIWAGLAAGCIVVFSQRLRHLVRLPQLAARLPAGEQLLRIGRATVAMRQHSGLVLMSLANTVVLQLLVVLSAWVMALALKMEGGFALYFVGVPIGFLIAAIPITPPQAFGVMEAAYIQFFVHEGLNNTAAQAFAFALAVRLTQLVWSLPGVLVPLLGAHMPSREELAALEQGDGAETEAAAGGEAGAGAAEALTSSPARP
jgi:hypothetical protein